MRSAPTLQATTSRARPSPSARWVEALQAHRQLGSQDKTLSKVKGSAPSCVNPHTIPPRLSHSPQLTPYLAQVLGLQRSSRLLPSRAAARSLVRAASDPARHDALMASFFAGQHPEHCEPAAGLEAGSDPATQLAPAAVPRSAVAHSRGSSASLDGLQADGGSASASEQDEEDANADRLLAEAATFGADNSGTGGWVQ